MEKYRGTR